VSGALQSLIDRIDRSHERAESIEALARSARDAVRERIADPEFALDCLERILYSPALGDMQRRWINRPVHVSERLNYQFRVFFWAPGYVNRPHRHNTWGVTGVLHEQCSVFLYRVEEAAPGDARFHVERRLVAEAGEVGYVLPGCTHSVGNPGASISATFHVFSGSQHEEDRAKDTVWYPERGGTGRAAQDHRHKVMFAAAEMLGRIKHERSARLLEHLFPLGGARVKLACAKALARVDPARAASRSPEFYAALPATAHQMLDEVLVGLRPSPVC